MNRTSDFLKHQSNFLLCWSFWYLNLFLILIYFYNNFFFFCFISSRYLEKNRHLPKFFHVKYVSTILFLHQHQETVTFDPMRASQRRSLSPTFLLVCNLNWRNLFHIYLLLSILLPWNKRKQPKCQFQQQDTFFFKK